MGAKKKQTEFRQLKKPKDYFGGAYLKNSNAKTKRSIDSKLPLHLVIRSRHAKGQSSMRHAKNFEKVNTLVRQTAKKHGIKIHEYANAGNHFHLLIKLHSRNVWSGFIRELSGRLATILQGLRGQDKGLAKFWDQRPFTRVVRGWKGFKTARDYVRMNEIEVERKLSRAEAKILLSLHEFWSDWPDAKFKYGSG